MARPWPALEEAFLVLRHLEAAETAGLAPRPESRSLPLPRPGPKLASSILFFLAALSTGDLSRWLGDRTIQTLMDLGKKTGRGNLLKRLAEEFSRLGPMTEAAAGEWRLFSIPLLDGAQIQQLRLFLRRGRPGGGGGRRDEDQEAKRFILEVDLSRLGGFQLDGLVRDKRFDLIARTRASLTKTMKRDIARIFHEANESNGFQGTIAFQASPDWRFLASGDTAVPPSPILLV